MRRFARLCAAVLLTSFAALGVAERAALHAHPLEENDLVPHSLSIVERGEDCGGGAHFDAAHRADHPVCHECALAAAAIAVGPSSPADFVASESAAPRLTALEAAPAWRSEHSAPARAPPAG